MSNLTTNILKDFRKKFCSGPKPCPHHSDYERFLETVISQVREETERRIAQKIYDKWNNSQDAEISFGDWLKNYLLIKSQSEDGLADDHEDCEARIREETLKEVKQFAFMEVDEPCEPDCTPERHAYFSGRYDSYRLIESWVEKYLKLSLKPKGGATE